ncbi:hypothetical protein [Phycicoccus flavus]|uniref:hypothetical protein n=1 Tax=Phycicoccus flavus TaxID=2502783 RepID=UPI000FEBE42B|nr:hypothetical protein [Phycicoccus flavus]NHA68854.1 hypothetical protein [Phycicoccus flavus]
MSKLTILAAAGVGYVLGARAGRERYDEIAATARDLWSSPTVRKGRDRTRQVALRKGREAGRAVGATVSDAGRRIGHTASATVGRDRGPDGDAQRPDPDPTAGVTTAAASAQRSSS